MDRRSFGWLVVAFASLVPSASPASADGVPAAKPVEPQLEFLFLEFGGLDDKKAAAVDKAIVELKGVRIFAWTSGVAEGKVIREVGTASDAALLAAATTAGATTAGVVPLAVATLTFVDVLHCAGCVRAVSTALRAIPSVKQVDVSATLDTVSISYDSRSGKIEEFEKALVAIEKPTKRRTTAR